MKRKAIALLLLCVAVLNIGCSSEKSEGETTEEETTAEETTAEETTVDETTGETEEPASPSQHESVHQAQRLFANDSLPEGDYLVYISDYDDDYSGITCDIYGYYGFTPEEYATIEEGDTVIVEDQAYTAHFEEYEDDSWIVLEGVSGEAAYYVSLLNNKFYILNTYFENSPVTYLLYSDYHLSFAEDGEIWDSYISDENMPYGVFGHKFEDAEELERLINEVADWYIANVSDATPEFWDFDFNASIENGLIETMIINPTGHQDWVPSEIRESYGAYDN